MTTAVATSRLDRWRRDRPGRSDPQLLAAGADDFVQELELEAPVNLELLASRLDIIDIARDDNLTVAGCLYCERGKPHVVVRGVDSWGRQRFTICHEFTHTFFPGYQLQFQFRCNPGTEGNDKQLESLCDTGAAELLMPRSLFRADLDWVDFSLKSIKALAERYESSVEAAGNRFAQIWPEDCRFVVFEVAQKPKEHGTITEPRLRVQRSSRTGRLPFLPKHKSVSDHGPFAEALLSGAPVRSVTDLGDVVRSPVRVEVTAERLNYRRAGQEVERVLALIRRL